MPSDYKSTETAIIFQKDWSIKLHQNKHCWCERPWIHEAFVLWIRQMKLFSTRIFKLFSAQLRTVSVWQSLSVRHIFLQTTALVEEPNLRHPLVAFITTVRSEASKTLSYVQDPELFWHIEFAYTNYAGTSNTSIGICSPFPWGHGKQKNIHPHHGGGTTPRWARLHRWGFPTPGTCRVGFRKASEIFKCSAEKTSPWDVFGRNPEIGHIPRTLVRFLWIMDHHRSSLMQLMKELSSFPSSGRAQHIQEEEPDQNHWHLNKDTLCRTVCPRMVCIIVHTSHFMAMSRGKIMINIGSNID